MGEDTEKRLDALLDDLAKDERTGWPGVTAALAERVLTDAAGAVVPAARPLRRKPHPAGIRRTFAFLADGWGAAAVAAMVAGLTIGLGVGLERDVDLFEADTVSTAEFSLADSGMLGDDTLF